MRTKIINFPLPKMDEIYFTEHYLQKHEDLIMPLSQKIPEDIVVNIISFCGTEYDEFSKYDWYDVETMFCFVLEYNVNITEHFFKKFKKFQKVIPVFYPNAESDPQLSEEEGYSKKINFNRFHWFDCVYSRSYPPFFDDGCTDYNKIVNMFVQILKKFDDWYWNDYNGKNVMETSLVENIVDIYKTLEKFYHADENMSLEQIDETIEKASCYL